MISVVLRQNGGVTVNATRILWGQVLTVCSIALAFIWAATQWTASALGYQAQLGAPWFRLGGFPVYHPPAFFWWWFAYDAYAPDVFVHGAYIAAAGGLAAVVVAIALSVWRAREAKTAETYGSARWATEKEVRKAGLLGDDGTVLGRLGDDYIRHDGPEHVLCFAPTRSGKGVGLVIPALPTWAGSVIVHDIKGENYALTAGWRARFSRILRFDPTDAESDAYTPLLEVRRGPNEVHDVQNVADILVDPEGALKKRNHWEKTSHALLVGAILHVLYAEPAAPADDWSGLKPIAAPGSTPITAPAAKPAAKPAETEDPAKAGIRREPEPSALIARRSTSQDSWKRAKSSMKAVWITASAEAAPLRSVSASLMSSRCASTPTAVNDSAAASERAKPST